MHFVPISAIILCYIDIVMSRNTWNIGNVVILTDASQFQINSLHVFFVYCIINSHRISDHENKNRYRFSVHFAKHMFANTSEIHIM